MQKETNDFRKQKQEKMKQDDAKVNFRIEKKDVSIYPNESDLEYPNEFLKLQLDFLDDEKYEDNLWKARTELNEENICGAIETIIFMSECPISLSKIRELIDVDIPLRVFHQAIEKLQHEYELSYHGIRLQEVAKGYQFRTKPLYSKYIHGLFKVSSLSLSPSSLEVLAIIAYKQPISKVEIEKIRGVDSSHIVRTMMEKKLVKIVGRSQELGKPVIYGTTDEFLEVFNLRTIDDLPPEYELKEMADEGNLEVGNIKEIISRGTDVKFTKGEIDELDELAASIKSIDSTTPFIRSLKVEEKRRLNEKGEKIKTSFDLLEEYMEENKIVHENREVTKPENTDTSQIIKGLSKEDFNTPKEVQTEELEMINLETGELISNVAEKTEKVIETVALESKSETDSLSEALDDAFSKLLSKGKLTLPETVLNSSELEEDLDQKTREIIEDAKELDIDLSFMKEKD